MRYGLIGCGGIGELRAQALQSVQDGELVVVCDIDDNKSKKMVNKYNAEIAENYSAVIERKDIEAIIIATPPSLHARIAIDALESGKHVLCEKPLARNSQECQLMLDAARDSGRYLATGYNYRYYPSFREAKDLFDNGMIGDLIFIRGYTGYTAAHHSQEWLHDQEIVGGGALRDNGTHLIDLAAFFLGDVTEINASASSNVWNFPGIEENGFAILKNSKGNIASLQASWTEWSGYKFGIEVYGTSGILRANCFPMKLEVHLNKDDIGKAKKRVSYFPKTFIFEHLRSYRWVVVQSFILELEDFQRASSGMSSSIASGKDGLFAIQVAEAAAYV